MGLFSKKYLGNLLRQDQVGTHVEGGGSPPCRPGSASLGRVTWWRLPSVGSIGLTCRANLSFWTPLECPPCMYPLKVWGLPQTRRLAIQMQLRSDGGLGPVEVVGKLQAARP